jgi:ribosomal protein L11 methyltransferase
LPWLSVAFDVVQARVDEVSDVLLEAGAVSVDILPASAREPDVVEPEPGETPTWTRNRLRALFDIDIDITTLKQAVGDLAARDNPLQVDFVEDADWQNAWRDEVREYLAGPELLIAPHHFEVDDGFEGRVLRMDPGLAFGSGGHPTTRLCLDWIAKHVVAGRSLLDYGCGSGILAVAAKALGAAPVLAVDHDPQALIATAENAQYNGVHLDAIEPPESFRLQQRVDILLANILANPLMEMADTLQRYTAPGGHVVLSGLLEDQVEVVARRYPRVQFGIPVMREGWVRLDGVLRGEHD